MLRRYPCSHAVAQRKKYPTNPLPACRWDAGTLGRWDAGGRWARCFCCSISKLEAEQPVQSTAGGGRDRHPESPQTPTSQPHLTTCVHHSIYPTPKMHPCVKAAIARTRRPHALRHGSTRSNAATSRHGACPTGYSPPPASYKSPQGEVIHARHAPAVLFWWSCNSCNHVLACRLLGLQRRLMTQGVGLGVGALTLT